MCEFNKVLKFNILRKNKKIQIKEKKMKYENIKKARFINRPNRFIANIEVDGKEQVCHVKNTGRCKELLTENAEIFVEEFDKNAKRKTKYDLISVYKNSKLINMDSQVPNKVVREWLQNGNLFDNITLIKPEYKYNNSRFDFYVEADQKKILIEVKGVTLEQDGVVMFPDAPTARGIKHIQELCEAATKGYQTYLIFVIQMEGAKYFTPNIKTHPEFGEALQNAKKSGVKIIAFDCKVSQNEIIANNPVKCVYNVSNL